MKLFTIKTKGEFTAGPKAPSDIVEICTKNFDTKSIILKQAQGAWGKIKYRLKMYSTFLSAGLKGETLVLQFPLYETSKILNGLFLFFFSFVNKDKTIVLIHDVEGIRNKDEMLLKQDIARLNKVGHIIAHNEKMKEKLVSLGVTSKIYNLELFDYLCDEQKRFPERKLKKNNLHVAYAGNLTKEKSLFLYQLDDSKLNFTFNLYGVGIDKDMNEKMKYMGKRDPNDLPNDIEGELGLVWDGNFDDSDEEEGFKQYTKYNNPHKLSCYVAAGLPVIVWEKAAIADFVKKHNIGYTISNLYEINNLNLSDYEEKLKNVQDLKLKVRDGYFTKRVLNEIFEAQK